MTTSHSGCDHRKMGCLKPKKDVTIRAFFIVETKIVAKI
jgi:hypothetical protein